MLNVEITLVVGEESGSIVIGGAGEVNSGFDAGARRVDDSKMEFAAAALGEEWASEEEEQNGEAIHGTNS